MSDVEWNEFVAGIARNPTPLYWTLFFMLLLLSGFMLGRRFEQKAEMGHLFKSSIFDFDLFLT